MLNHWIRSLSARLWVTSIIALAVCLTALSMGVTYIFNQFPEQTLGRHEQMESAQQVADGIAFDDTGVPVSVQLPAEGALLFAVAPTELKYRVLDAQGNLLLASVNARDGGPWTEGEFSAAVGRIQRIQIDRRPFDIVTLRAPHANAIYYVQVATSSRFLNALVGMKIKPLSIIVKIIVFVTTIIFGLTLTFTVRRVLRPLRDASSAAALITPGKLTTRLSLRGMPSEIKPLVHAFNDALGRLENGFTVQQQFLASAAHELQTPLTLLRAQIELQSDIKDKERLFREIDLLARQTRQLLHLAEVGESQNFSFSEVNTVEVARDVLAYLGRKADMKHIKLVFEATDEPISIWADSSALFLLLKNIVENAINASSPDSVVSLVVRAVSIEVRDEGPGIREEYMPFLFKRFWRAPGAKHDGAGLGLAICWEIAAAHQWRLTVSSLTSGTRFIVWL